MASNNSTVVGEAVNQSSEGLAAVYLVYGPELPHSTLSNVLIGIAIALYSLPGLIANIVVMVVFIKGGFLVQTGSEVYRLLASVALGDTIMLLLLLFYLAPACIMQSFIVGPPFEALAGDIFLLVWYNMTFLFTVVAFNRYLAICRPPVYKQYWTPKISTICVVVIWILAIFCYTLYLMFPCCRYYVNPYIYSFSWEAASLTETNWGDLVLEWPGNIVSTGLQTYWYARVIYEIRKSRQSMSQSNASHAERMAKRARKREIRVAVQLITIAAIFFGSLPLEVHIMMPFLVITNSTANPVIYLIYNEAIRAKLYEMLGRTYDTHETVTMTRTQKHERTASVAPILMAVDTTQKLSVVSTLQQQLRIQNQPKQRRMPDVDNPGVS